jgi:hypothetical protein
MKLLLVPVLVDDGLHYFKRRSLLLDNELSKFLDLNLLMFLLELLHAHKATADTNCKGAISNGRNYEASANQVFRVIDTDDGHAELVEADVILQKFVDSICIYNCFILKSLCTSFLENSDV